MRFTEHELTRAMEAAAKSVLAVRRSNRRRDVEQVWAGMTRYQRYQLLDSLGDQVLPVLFGAVPLTQDHLENRPLFRTIFMLFKTQPQVLQPYLDKLLSLFAYVLDPNAPDQIGDEIRGELLGLLATLYREVPDKVRAAGLAVFVEA